MKRKVCIITGTRAEYGLLYWLMKEIQADADLQLQIIGTGMHLSPEFGLTYRQIEKDGFKIDKNPLIANQPNKFIPLNCSKGAPEGIIPGPNRKSAIPNPKSEMSLAERTFQDVLLHFGDNLGEPRRRYRHFVKQGVDQGKRPDLQGGGLVRSSGGEKAGLLGRKEEDRELSDQRILGSGDFVAEVLRSANEFEEERIKKSIQIDQLADKITSYFGIKIDDILVKSQKSKISKARSIICYLAIKEMKYSGTSVGKFLNIRRYSALPCAERGKKRYSCA